MPHRRGVRVTSDLQASVGRAACLCLLVILLVGCEPQATPLPAYIPPAPTAPPTAVEPQAVRYALTADTRGAVPDLGQIEASAQVEHLTDPLDSQFLGTLYDLAAGYGERAGWTRSPVTPTVALVLNTALPPLNNPDVAATIRAALDTQALIGALSIDGARLVAPPAAPLATPRIALANAGLPDGFNLRYATLNAPRSEVIVAQWDAMGLRTTNIRSLDVGAAYLTGQIHVAIIVWTNPDSRAAWANLAGDANTIDLYTVPISYWAADGLTVDIAAGGFPIPISS